MLGNQYHHRYYLRKKYVHHCTLPEVETVKVEEFYPYACFLTRKFLKSCLISNNVNRRQIYSKSHKVLEKERKAQLKNYNFVIHPFSDLSYYIQIFMIFIFMLQLTVTPILITDKLVWPSGNFILCTQIFCTLNVIICCFTGHYRSDIKKAVLDRKAVVLYYFKTGYLIIETLGAIPFPYIASITGYSILVQSILCILIAFNICPLMRYLEIIRIKRGFSFMVFRLLASFLAYLFGMFWISVLIFIGVHLDSLNKDLRQNVKLWWWLYKSYTFMYGTDIADFCFVGFEFLFSTIAIIFGMLIRIIMLVQLIIMLKTWYVTQRKRVCLFKELNEFCHYKRLPNDLKQRLLQYYTFKIQNVYYNETEIKSQLSENLRHNIKDYLCRAWFKADIFRLCPLALRQLITLHLEEEIYFKDDVIYRAGTPYEYIYFIKSGSVYRIRDDTHEVYEVVEGNFISEKALLKNYDEPHRSTIVAVEACHMFKLAQSEFFKLIENFQASYAVILDILENRNRYLSKNKLTSQLRLRDYYRGGRRSTAFNEYHGLRRSTAFEDDFRF